MNFSVLSHKNCGGYLYADVRDIFCIETPSISISPDGIFLGVLELNLASSKEPKIKFRCGKCNSTLSNDSKDVYAKCLACSKIKEIAVMYTSKEIPCICEDCLESLREENDNPIPEHLLNIASWIRITKSIKVVKLTTILKKKVHI